MEVKGAPKQPDYKLSSKYLPLYSVEQTFIQVWNYLRVSKLQHNFHFWVNYPFRYASVARLVYSTACGSPDLATCVPFKMFHVNVM